MLFSRTSHDSVSVLLSMIPYVTKCLNLLKLLSIKNSCEAKYSNAHTLKDVTTDPPLSHPQPLQKAEVNGFVLKHKLMSSKL